MRQLIPSERVVAISRWAPTMLVALALCAAPIWLWGVPLRWFFLKSDDFAYLGQSRTVTALLTHLVTPHNGHVAPLFLLETHLLARLAGSLERLPAVLSWASWATLVIAMLATGHVVAWETGRPAIGLVAMATVGLSSVMGPTALWYAAGQAIVAGIMIMLMLSSLQLWRARGSLWALALAFMASIAAPLFWSAGYVAGLVAMAYLWADGRSGCRRVSVWFPVSSVVLAVIIWKLAGSGFAPASHLATQSPRNLLALDSVIVLSAQTVCESLVLNNLGLDAATTGVQGLCFGVMLVGIWGWSRRRSRGAGLGSWPRANPLEAGGAVLVTASFGLIFAGRGVQSSIDGLRTMGWYHAMADLGAVLFALGWWSGPIEPPPPRSVEPPRRLELLVVLLFAIVMFAVQSPRVDRIIYEYDGASAPVAPGATIVATPHTAASLAARARAQRHALDALDHLEQTARESGMDLATVRQAVSRISLPGFPYLSPDVTPADLLDLPDRDTRFARSPTSE